MSPKEGFKHSLEAIEKMRLAKLGKKNPMFGTRGGMFGKKHNEEAKKKMSQSRIGRKGYWEGKKFSEETKKKMSRSHKERYQRTGTQHISGKNGSNWKGGRSINSDGYIFIYKPNHPRANCDRRILEHHLIWEEYWGEFIPDGYVIHHLDDNRQNNHITNLTSMSNRNHLKFHRKKYLNSHLHK